MSSFLRSFFFARTQLGNVPLLRDYRHCFQYITHKAVLSNKNYRIRTNSNFQKILKVEHFYGHNLYEYGISNNKGLQDTTKFL